MRCHGNRPVVDTRESYRDIFDVGGRSVRSSSPPRTRPSVHVVVWMFDAAGHHQQGATVSSATAERAPARRPYNTGHGQHRVRLSWPRQARRARGLKETERTDNGSPADVNDASAQADEFPIKLRVHALARKLSYHQP